ncbi:hypothetical protein R6Q57_018612 [Mikania cordata]
MKSDRRFHFATGSTKPVPLTTYPVETKPNISDDSEPNEMFKNFNSTFVKNDVITESISSSLQQENRDHSTITKEAGLKLNPNCEPLVPTGSLEQASTSTSSGHGDCDVKPFDPK